MTIPTRTAKFFDPAVPCIQALIESVGVSKMAAPCKSKVSFYIDMEAELKVSLRNVKMNPECTPEELGLLAEVGLFPIGPIGVSACAYDMWLKR